MRYRVTAAYVTARVRDAQDQWVLKGFHNPGLLPEGTHEEDIEKLLRKTMIEPVEAPKPVEEPAEEAEEPEAEEPKPAKRTTKAAS